MAPGLFSTHPLGETSHSVRGRGGPSASCSPRGRGPSPWSPWALLRKGGSLRGAPPRGQAAHGALGPPVAPGRAGWSGEGTRVAAPSPPPDTVLPRPTLRLPAPPAPPRFPRPSRAGLRTPGRIGLARPGDPGRGAAGAEAAPGLRISAPVVRPGGACPRPAPEGWRRHVPRGSRPSPGAAAGGGAAGGSLSAPLRPPRPRVPMSRVPRVPVSPRPRIPAGASRTGLDSLGAEHRQPRGFLIRNREQGAGPGPPCAVAAAQARQDGCAQDLLQNRVLTCVLACVGHARSASPLLSRPSRKDFTQTEHVGI